MILSLSVLISLLSFSTASNRTRRALSPCSVGANVRDLLRNNKDTWITRTDDKLYINAQEIRLAGANIYWWGLGENGGANNNEVNHPTPFRIEDSIDTAYYVMGATVIRCHTAGINLGLPSSFHPVMIEYNHSALHTVDYALYLAKKRGMRVIIPLTDYWDFYHGGRYTFTNWRGLPVEDFWTSAIVRMDWQAYIWELLTHVNMYTGVAYKDDPTIVAFETGNELKLAPVEWTDDTCKYIKSLSSNHLVMSGSFGPNPNEFNLECLDMLSNHYYHATMQETQTLEKDAYETTQIAKKIYVVGEYGWPDCSLPQLKTFVEMMEKISVGISAFWSIFPHDDVSGFRQHHDGYSFYFPGVNDNTQTRMIYMRGHAFCMAQDYPPPAMNQVGIAVITSISNTGRICWRGAFGAAKYNLFRATRTSSFSQLTGTLTDFEGCYDDPPRGVCYRYQIQPVSFDGTAGQVSGSVSNAMC